ncbi:Translocase, Inner Mitochondrial Membrane [Caenorhabditis elegans]|uniref:Translocase, Inner Mitochondrial Membrane n=2 Tax=Caenorhabditis elegans TaxID=6239 RepID=Q19012_CAEEL|nr:Translocase, Inner Mitochondrial Membrane [Caenorhabditis elegans]CCD68520.1 Translocase, Inner Mitochondrial Membrane [Caenorhabditis elegans]|eukprot:NP_501427.2 Translocase, Inner Mitochondrial Membrane [Caenorhabditis elegans]
MREVRMRSTLAGVQFAAWGGLFSTIDCCLVANRKKEDSINSIVSGGLTGALLAIRSPKMERIRLEVIELGELMGYVHLQKKVPKAHVNSLLILIDTLSIRAIDVKDTLAESDIEEFNSVVEEVLAAMRRDCLTMPQRVLE